MWESPAGSMLFVHIDQEKITAHAQLMAWVNWFFFFSSPYCKVPKEKKTSVLHGMTFIEVPFFFPENLIEI